MSLRVPIAAGNWKMHLDADEARELARGILAAAPPAGEVEVMVFPSAPLIPAVLEAVETARVQVGGQDLHPDDWGAHTGDVSGRQLASVGCSRVLVGHSERRHDHGEGDELVAAKLAAAARCGLEPVLCVGETKAERDAGRTFEVLGRQLASALGATTPLPAGLVLAYEPVWAIGTGDTATPDQAQEAHAFLRRRLGETVDEATAQGMRILYGGSVKPANAEELAREPDIDGFLVGGASLDAGNFSAIIRALRP